MTPVLTSAAVASAASPLAEMDARAYTRAHAGKLMIIHRNGKRPCATEDFFRFESAGTHPTGLFVTGVFGDSQRRHMLSSAVREATAEEIEWRNSAAESLNDGALKASIGSS